MLNRVERVVGLVGLEWRDAEREWVLEEKMKERNEQGQRACLISPQTGRQLTPSTVDLPFFSCFSFLF